MSKIRAFIIIVVGVFIATAGPLFIANAAGNVFTVPWSTWQIIISGGIFGVVTWLLATIVPVAIKPSQGMRFPEA